MGIQFNKENYKQFLLNEFRHYPCEKFWIEDAEHNSIKAFESIDKFVDAAIELSKGLAFEMIDPNFNVVFDILPDASDNERRNGIKNAFEILIEDFHSNNDTLRGFELIFYDVKTDDVIYELRYGNDLICDCCFVKED